MKAVIVAGGKGERLKPLTDSIPKPMVEVAGEPILQHIINLLKKAGINSFILALCKMPQVIEDYFGNGSKFGVNIRYTYEEESNPLGTAGAIYKAKQFINETFIVTYADILRELDVKSMLKQHQEKNAFATLNVYRRSSQGAKSYLEFGEDKKITKFVERPNAAKLAKEIWTNGSFYILDPGIFRLIPKNKKIDFGQDIFPMLLKEGKPIYAFPSKDYFIDIGDLEKLDRARQTFKPS